MNRFVALLICFMPFSLLAQAYTDDQFLELFAKRDLTLIELRIPFEEMDSDYVDLNRCHQLSFVPDYTPGDFEGIVPIVPYCRFDIDSTHQGLVVGFVGEGLSLKNKVLYVWDNNKKQVTSHIVLSKNNKHAKGMEECVRFWSGLDERGCAKLVLRRVQVQEDYEKDSLNVAQGICNQDVEALWVTDSLTTFRWRGDAFLPFTEVTRGKWDNKYDVCDGIYYDAVIWSRSQKGKKKEDRCPLMLSPRGNPKFPGGSAALKEYVESHVHYPKEALDSKKEGYEVVRLTIEPDGSVGDVCVLHSMGPAFDQEVFNLVHSMPKWTPCFSCKKVLRNGAVRYELSSNLIPTRSQITLMVWFGLK